MSIQNLLKYFKYEIDVSDFLDSEMKGLYYLYIALLLAHFVLIIGFILLNIAIMAYCNIVSIVSFTVIILLHRKAFFKAAFYTSLVEMLVHASLATVCTGLNSNFYLYNIAWTAVLVHNPLCGKVEKNIQIFSSFLIVAATVIIASYYGPIYVIPQELILIIATCNILLVIGLYVSMSNKYFHMNTMLRNKLKEQADRDALTGAYNRRFFNEYLEIELKREDSFYKYKLAKFKHVSFGIAIIDVDDFKKINDKFGHLSGDNVLKQIVNILNDVSFKRDIVCRYGGEEFVILMTRTSAEDIKLALEKVRKAVENYKFYFNDDLKEGHVTVSIGGACYQGNGKMNKTYLLDCADQKLYEAKHMGKNMVVI